MPHDKAHDPYGMVGVPKFWKEVRSRYRHLEIEKVWSQDWAGIRALFLRFIKTVLHVIVCKALFLLVVRVLGLGL